MIATFAYSGHSAVIDRPGGRQIFEMVPNLAREPVAFDAPLLQPLRFREAMSALHDCVISDLRFKKKDKTAYKDWKKDEAGRGAVVRRGTVKGALAGGMARRGTPPPAGFTDNLRRAPQK